MLVRQNQRRSDIKMDTVKTGSGRGEQDGPCRFAYLSPLAVIALSFGYAVGWGSFVLPGTVFLPNAGPAGTIIGLLIGTVAMIVLAYNYHKVTVSVQGSGGVYGFVTKVFGQNHGFLVGWFLFLTYVAIMWANASALVLLARYLFGNMFQFGFHYVLVGFDIYFGEVLLSLAAIVFCGCACILSKKFAIRFHTFCAFVLAAGVVVCFIAALFGHKGGMASMGPAFSAESPVAVQILRIIAMVPWAFVGFEAVVQSSSEFRFPVRRTFSLLLIAILVSSLIYILLVILPTLSLPEGYSTWKEYIDALPRLKGIAAMPVFSAVERSFGPLGVALIGGSMLAAQLTALFATYIAVSRLMRAMSEDEMIPAWMGWCNREGTPVNAILFVMGISCLVPFLGRTVIGWPVDVSNLGAAIAYGYTSAAVLAQLKNDQGGHFFEKAAGIFGLSMSIVFSLLMLVPIYLSGSSLSTESYLLLTIWCFLGFLPYRRVFVRDNHGQFGKSIVVWVTVLIVIFFSSQMWFRLAVCDSAEISFNNLVGKTVSSELAESSISHVSTDMLFKSGIELCILFSSLSVILNLISILHRRENNLIVEKLKAEESANHSKSYFFSTISHDIRTPLNAIIGYAQMFLLDEFKQEEERKQALNSILSGGKTLLRIINDAIDFSKLEDGRLDFEMKPANCNGLLMKIVEPFRNSPLNQTVEFRCRLGEIPTVMVDPRRVRQILFNLVDNAAKFTRKGFVEVRSSFTRDAGSDSGTLRFEIEDTGCGISREDLPRIANPYVQVDSEHARHGGTGLGLAVSRKLTEAMGGALTIESVLRKGSTFTVTLPNVKVSDAAPEEEDEPVILHNPVRATAPQPEQPAAAAEQSPEPAACRRVLIADDQKVNLIVLKTMLKKLGSFDIVTAKDGKEALDILSTSEKPFDIVLTDMWMPVMDGEELVRTIRADGKFAAMPVHVVTADTEMPEKFRQIGFDGILLKPVTVEKLKALIG